MRYINIVKASVFFVACLFFVASTFAEDSAKEKNLPLKVAIFSRNKTNNQNYEKYVDMLRNAMISQLSGQFTIIDKDDVINTFQKMSKENEVNEDEIEKESDREGNVDRRSIEEKSSALRITQMIGADYFLVADLEEIVSNKIQEKGAAFGNDINDLVLTTDVTVKILDGAMAGSILADNIRTQKRIYGGDKTSFTDIDIAQNIPVIVKQAAKDISRKFLENAEKIRDFRIETAKVNFAVKSNIDDVMVEMDGAVLGTAPGVLQGITGVHRIRLTKDGYRSFERDVNLFEGMAITVSLEETKEGIDRYERKKDIDMNVREREAVIVREEKKTGVEIKEREAVIVREDKRTDSEVKERGAAILREDKRTDAEAYSIKKKADAEYKWGTKREASGEEGPMVIYSIIKAMAKARR